MIELLDFRGGKTTINTSKFPNMETMVDIKNITGIDITTFIVTLRVTMTFLI